MRDRVADPVGRADRARQRLIVPLPGEETLVAEWRARRDIGQLVAQPRLGLEPAEVELLQREQASLVGLVLGQERFVADHVEHAVEILHARRAEPGTALGLDQLEPRLGAVIVEGGADRSVLLQFEMAIGRMAGAKADLVEEAAAGAHFAAQVQPVLHDVEPRCLLALPGQGRIADRHAVQAVIMAVRDAEIAGVGDDRGADARSPGLGCRMGSVPRIAALAA